MGGKWKAGLAYHLASSTGTNWPGNCCWINATGTTGCCSCSIPVNILDKREGVCTMRIENHAPACELGWGSLCLGN